MSQAFIIHKQEAAYFLTMQIVYWIDLFSRRRYRDILADSLNFCIEQKGLNVFSYVIMSNHVHVIVNAGQQNLSKILGEMKTHTSKKIIESIYCGPESRREWMLKLFSHAASKHKRNENFQVWTHENHAEECFSPAFTFQRVKYIHENPVRAGIVEREEDYLYSSARDYAGLKSPVKVDLLNLHSLMS
jgi:REP element-mobilizing transposase RayT